MKEIVFLKKNQAKWQHIEKETRNIDGVHPDKLEEYFVELCEDLSYARTYYRNSPVTKYLNTLTARIYQTIYHLQTIRFSQVLEFWKKDVPLAMASSWRIMLVSFVIFVISVAIGVISTLNDNEDYEFARQILGSSYVDLTLQNIKAGKPMAVYQEEEPLLMFLLIAYNNVKVAFNAFVWGGVIKILGIPAFFLLSLGTAYVLFVNGVMVGTFQTLFYKENLFWDSASVIWLHGTIEIWSIVLAGGAGIVVGNSVLFPGTYLRRESFRRGAEKGGKIILSLVPFFVFAAFIESFVTRYTDMPIFLKVVIIATSFLVVTLYYVVYPFIVAKKEQSLQKTSYLVTKE